MSRWIDADAFVADARMVELQTANEVLFALDHQPSIDIARCCECKWADKCSQNVAMQDTYQMYEKIDFCSYGEREGE